jgi:hypothetical protein
MSSFVVAVPQAVDVVRNGVGALAGAGVMGGESAMRRSGKQSWCRLQFYL